MKYSCIIPYYREGSAIYDVIRAVLKMKHVDDVVLVDDGSQDEVAQMIRSHFPQVRLITYKENKGKSYAVSQGLATARNKYIFLLDADLQGVSHKEFDSALAFFTKEKPDMLVFRIYTPHTDFEAVFNKYLLFSGTRILKRSDLQKILKTKAYGYQLETAINQYFMTSKKVYWMQSSAVNPNKIQKLGFLKGFIANVKMELSIIAYAGFANHLRQLLFTAWKQAK